MDRRVSILLVGVVYILAFGAFVAAMIVFTGAQRSGRQVSLAAAGTREAANPEAKNLPTLRRIWPESGTPRSRRPTRTLTPSSVPTQASPAATDIPTQVARPAQHRAPSPLAPRAISPLATPLSSPKPTQGRPTAYVQPLSPLAQPQSPLPTAYTSQGGSGAVAPTVTPQPTYNQLIVTLTPQPSPTNRVPVSQSPWNTPTAGPSPTPDPSQGALARIYGRLVYQAAPYGSPLTVTLESQANHVVALAAVAPSGYFTFTSVPRSPDGYKVVFSQENNPLVPVDEAATWAWLGPITIQPGQTVQLPEMEIGLLNFQPSEPLFDQSYTLAELASNHIVFNWQAYPNAQHYWLDLAQGAELIPAWKSQYVQQATAEWNGLLANNQPAVPGEYWWAVGAQRSIGAYTLTVYTYLTKFNITQ